MRYLIYQSRVAPSFIIWTAYNDVLDQQLNWKWKIIWRPTSCLIFNLFESLQLLEGNSVSMGKCIGLLACRHSTDVVGPPKGPARWILHCVFVSRGCVLYLVMKGIGYYEKVEKDPLSTLHYTIKVWNYTTYVISSCSLKT